MPRHYRLAGLDLKPMVEHGIVHNPAYGMLKLDEWEAQLRNSIALNTSPCVIGRLAIITVCLQTIAFAMHRAATIEDHIKVLK